MSKTTVIYHNADFDGIFCREIAKHFLPDATLIGWDYGDPVPTPDVVSAEDNLFMLDISVETLMGHPRLVWIDHHKSAMEKYHHGIPGYRIDGVAACRLAWQWFSLASKALEGEFNFERCMTYFGVARYTDGVEPHNNNSKLPTKEQFIERTVVEPYAVRLAGEYDIWDKRDPNADCFQHGLRSQVLTDQTWKMLLDPAVEKSLEGTGMEVTNSELICGSLLNQGRCLQFAKANENEAIIKRQGFTIQWEGLTFLACNHAQFNSHLFTAGIRPEHDALLGFRFDGTHFHVSLYHAPAKEHHDLSLIAVKHGGGGHRGACGFRTDKLPFIP